MSRLPAGGQPLVLLRLLVQLREDACLNQTALAGRLGITQSEVSKFERGERALDVVRLRAWLRALGVETTPSEQPQPGAAASRLAAHLDVREPAAAPIAKRT